MERGNAAVNDRDGTPNVRCATLIVQCGKLIDQCAILNVECGKLNVQCATSNVECARLNVQFGTLIVGSGSLNVQFGKLTDEFGIGMDGICKAPIGDAGRGSTT